MSAARIATAAASAVTSAAIASALFAAGVVPLATYVLIVTAVTVGAIAYVLYEEEQ